MRNIIITSYINYMSRANYLNKRNHIIWCGSFFYEINMKTQNFILIPEIYILRFFSGYLSKPIYIMYSFFNLII